MSDSDVQSLFLPCLFFIATVSSCYPRICYPWICPSTGSLSPTSLFSFDPIGSMSPYLWIWYPMRFPGSQWWQIMRTDLPRGLVHPWGRLNPCQVAEGRKYLLDTHLQPSFLPATLVCIESEWEENQSHVTSHKPHGRFRERRWLSFIQMTSTGSWSKQDHSQMDMKEENSPPHLLPLSSTLCWVPFGCVFKYCCSEDHTLFCSHIPLPACELKTWAVRNNEARRWWPSLNS